MLDIRKAPEEDGIERPAGTQQAGTLEPVFTVRGLQDLADRIHRASCLDGLVDSILAGLEDSFGFKQSMILVPAEQERTLVTLATRGYDENGARAEVRFGEGIAGMVADAQADPDLGPHARHALRAGDARLEVDPDSDHLSRAIPLHGLSNPESQLDVPCWYGETRGRARAGERAALPVS